MLSFSKETLINKNLAPQLKFKESKEPANVQGLQGRFLYEINVIDKEEYQLPDWVEDEDKKAREKNNSKKGKKKKPAKKCKKPNQRKEENLLAKASQLANSEEKPFSGESGVPASQVRLILFSIISISARAG